MKPSGLSVAVSSLCDWVWPRLVGGRSVDESEQLKLTSQVAEIATRVNQLGIAEDSLDVYLATSEGALERERSRRASVESRLIAVAGLMSIAATVVLGTLLSFATDKEVPALGYARYVAPGVCAYLALQLTAAIHAAIQGLKAASYQSDLPQDLIPAVGQWGFGFRKERIRSVLEALVQHRSVNNKKFSQLNIAYTAMRNFLWALLLAAALAALLAVARPPVSSHLTSIQSHEGASAAKVAEKGGIRGRVSFLRLAVVGPFEIGSHLVDGERLLGCLRSAISEISSIGDIRGWQLIGRADRRSLTPETLKTYGSNEALAMARTKTVSEILSSGSVGFHENQAASSISGPQAYSLASSDYLVSNDRIVEVFVIVESELSIAFSVRHCEA